MATPTILNKETPACNAVIHLSLSTNCEAIITPDVVLEAPDMMNSYRIFITSPSDSLGYYSNNGTDSVVLLQTGTYAYSIIDSADDFCAGQIIAEDKLAPSFTSLPRDTFVNCIFNLTELGIGATLPIATDNCGGAMVSFESAAIEEGNTACDTNIIASLWKAVDAFGNITIDTQRTVFIQPKINQFIAPEDITLSCGEDESSDIDNFTKTGYPSIQIGKIINDNFIVTDTVLFGEGMTSCNFGISHRDIRKTIDCEIEVTRFWEVIDWCNSNSTNITIDTQIIRFVDTIAPIFEIPEHGSLLNPKRIDLNEQCQFDVMLTQPMATDNCDTVPKVEMYEVAQLTDGIFVNIGSNLNSISLSADTFRLGYRAFDNCVYQPKEDTTFVYLITKDITAPAVICANDLIISIANDQGVILDAVTVDDGSFDACGKITRAIRRKDIDSSWQSSIFLPCELVDSQLLVELRITDIAGNESFCWTSVRLEDNVSPTCQNLPDQIITCEVIKANDFGLSTDTNNNGVFEDGEWHKMTNNQMIAYNQTFGAPACLENITCNFFTIEQQYQRLDNTCGMAEIQRRYRGIDAQGNIGNWATQIIRVNYQADWEITFSPDWEGNCNEAIPIPFIKIQNGVCDNLSISITENTFPAADDYCLKVERIYQVINTCLLRPSTIPLTISRPENSDGNVVDSLTISSDSLGTNAHLLYKQILKIRSTERPDLVIQEVETCLTGIHSDSINAKIDSLQNCGELRTFTAAAKDCVGNDITNYLWNFFENDSLKESGTGDSFTKTVVPNIDYTVQFIAIDACNNQAEERKDFTFLDCAKPTLFTRTGIALELTEKAIEIWANDFDNGSHDNCTDQATLLDNFRIWHEKLGFDYPEDIANIKTLPKLLTFTCEELTTQEVFIYAFDEADNFDYTSVFVAVQDNRESCLEINRVRIAGQIMNEKGEEIEAVNINLLEDNTLSERTVIDGHYLFDIPSGKNYTIEPIKNTNPLNGITTFDLVLINKHILGIAPFNSPYQHIAADVNKSGTITAFDLVHLRKLILNLISDFPANNSWRFIDSNYEFITEKPEREEFPEQMSLNAIDTDYIGFNFIGVKIGDINGSAISNSLKLANTRNIKDAFKFEFQDRWIKMGEVVEIPFVINNLKEIEGLQFALAFEELEVLNFEEGVARAEHFNLKTVDNGQLAMSWFKTTELRTDNYLFKINFKAKNAGLLSNLLSIQNERMPAEAYTNNQEIRSISLAFSNNIQQEQFELFQNKPNPFKHQTIIPFYLPKAGFIDLKIMDIQGRVLQHLVKRYEIGFNEVVIDSRIISTTGVLYYQLTDGNRMATKKMIILE